NPGPQNPFQYTRKKPIDDKSTRGGLSKKKSSISKFADDKNDNVSNVSLKSNRKVSLVPDQTFRCSGYDAPSLEPVKEYYPPKSDFISLPSSTPLGKSSLISNKEATVNRRSLEIESDLRSRLFKRINQKAVSVSDKQKVSHQPQQKETSEEAPKNLDFKIKTLEEIRRERERKRGLENGASNPVSDLNTSGENKADNDTNKPSKRLKITRKSKELYAKAASIPPQEKEEEVSLLTVSSSTQEKRKSVDSESQRNSKMLKQSFDDSSTFNGSTKQDKAVVKSLGSFLRRPKAKISPPSNQPPVTSTTKTMDNKENEEDTAMPPDSANTTLDNIESPVTDLISSTSPMTTSTTNQSFDDQESNRLPTSVSVKLASNETVSTTDESSVKPAENTDMERSVSVDEFDSFLNDENMSPEGEDSAYGDDILLEVEQFLDS
ncbi:hypothetical protein JTE90_016581, partial [Oedothorax gibbosus]